MVGKVLTGWNGPESGVSKEDNIHFAKEVRINGLFHFLQKTKTEQIQHNTLMYTHVARICVSESIMISWCL